MTPFILYVARAGLYLSLFYAFYLLVMRRTTFFRLNRALLLSGSYLCLLLPLIPLRKASASAVASQLTLVGVGESAVELPSAGAPLWKELLLALYAAGALFTLVCYLISAWKMNRLIRRGESLLREGCRLVLLDEDVASFSWGRTVVMGRKDLQENPAIFTHERMHVRHRHSLDLLLLLPLQVLFWWNPLVWITREELRLLHEYEADEGVLQKGIDATQYQLLLVRKAVGDQRFSLASGFQHAKLKNRITMMIKPTSSPGMRWAYLVLVPVLMVFMFACNPQRNAKVTASGQETAAQTAPEADLSADLSEEAVPYELVEKKPSFNGEDASTSFAVWVNSHLKYPEQAYQDKAQGRVLLQFTIGTDGAVRDVKVLRSAREDLDAEAVRVVSASPRWEPAMMNGKSVPVTYLFPVVYKLQ